MCTEQNNDADESGPVGEDVLLIERKISMVKQTTDLTQLAAAAVATSPKLQEDLSDFVNFVLDEAYDLLENGTPKSKEAIILKLIPHLVRQMHEKTDDEEMAEMRREMEALKAHHRDSIGGNTYDSTTPTTEPIPKSVQRTLKAVGFDSIPTDNGQASVIKIRGE